MLASRQRCSQALPWLPLLAACAVAGASASTAGGEADELGLEQRVDAIFAEYDNTRSPGCALGVYRNGEMVLARGYGMANLEHGVPNSPTTVFRIGSTSKQFSTAAVLLLAEEGRLSLDDDVRRHLPELPDLGATVSLRHLIHHTSGYRDYLTLMYLAGKRDEDFYTVEEVLEMLARQRQLNFPPGREHLYSNTGYFLLSQIVERAGGKSLRRYAEERIFGPLGMRHTHFRDNHREVVPHRAAGYAPADGGGFEISMTTLEMVGDGGLLTSVEDLLLWDRNFYDPRVGGEALLERLHERGRLDDGRELDYAFGLSHTTYRGLRVVSHGGAFVGFRAQLMRFPSERFSVVCLCNRADADPTRLARRVADVYLADRMAAPEPERTGESALAAEAKTIDLGAEALGAYTGLYYSPELDATYVLELVGDELRFWVGPLEPQPLLAAEPDVLVSESRRFRFERDAEDRVAGFLLDAGRVNNLRFERLQGAAADRRRAVGADG